MKEKLLGGGGDEVSIIYVVSLRGSISLLLLNYLLSVGYIQNIHIINFLHLSEQAI